MTRKLRYSQYEKIKQIIGDLVEDYGTSYPVDLTTLLDHLKITVIEHHGDFTGRGAGVHTRDGYTVVTESPLGICFTIHLNADMPPTRQRFTLAHELGHIILDHFLSTCTLTNEEQEGAANFFAGYLLAPDVRILALPEFTVDAIAAAFALSHEAAGRAHARAMKTLNRHRAPALYDTQLSAAEHRSLPGQFRQAASDH